MRATKAIIHLDNLIHNISVIRAHIGGTIQICMPVKADAYGHGAQRIAKTAAENGVDIFAVATVDEGIALRQSGISQPVLLLSHALPEELEAAAAHKLIPFVSDKAYIADFARAAAKTSRQKSAVYLKIDTGMGRCGCAPETAVELARFIAEQNLELAGTATHFAAAGSSNKDDIAWTQKQIMLFNGAINAIKNAGLDPGTISAANSAAAVWHSGAWFDMVRPGIMLYGYDDSNAPLSLKPLMELVTQLMLIKKINKGEPVSYGRSWIAGEDTHIGVLPIGYADGLPRRLSTAPEAETDGAFSVVINGGLYPLAGRICMDQCMVDLGAVLKVRRYDKVTIFGAEKPALDAAGIARRTGTIPYEITCAINHRVPRVYVS